MSYGDESYRRETTHSAPFFRPTPSPSRPSSPPPSSSSAPRATKRASQARAALATKIIRPSGKINLVLGIDTTGSNTTVKKNVVEKMQYFCDDIKNLFPDLVGNMEICFVGVGDHCDGQKVIQARAFSADVDTLKNNLETIEDTGGGDAPEAYECLFREMNNWDIANTNTVFVLVADSIPHGAGYSSDDGCPDNVDWKEELTALKKKVRAFYFISCTDHSSIERLQKLMADDEKHFIELGSSDSSRITNLVHGIIAQEVGEIDKYLDHLKNTRGAARATQVSTLLKTQQK